MCELDTRLRGCFLALFPDLPPQELTSASQDRVPHWDSVATVTLLGVIEDEFGIRFDLERLAEYDSYPAIRAYLEQALGQVPEHS